VSCLIYCYAECCYAECHYVECHYVECRYVECHYVECRYAECHYAECRGAALTANNLLRTPAEVTLAVRQVVHAIRQSRLIKYLWPPAKPKTSFQPE
jgi:hypothetical protein